jgi:flagellin
LLDGRYTAGMYRVNAGDSLQDLINKVNAGTQSRVGIRFGSAGAAAAAAVNVTNVVGTNMSAFAVCVGNEAYVWGSSAAATAELDSTKTITSMNAADADMGRSLTSAINHNADSQFWAMFDASAGMVYVFAKEGGDNNNLVACEQGISMASAANTASMQSALGLVSFQNMATLQSNQSGANFSLGGEKWASMQGVQTKAQQGNEVWNVILSGRDVGRERDLWIANIGSGSSVDFSTSDDTKMLLTGMGSATAHITGMGRDTFIEVQNADNAAWAGAEIRTQSSAQEALDALTEAITKKDQIRADLGAMQNRLENTMTNLEIQAENLQAAESRISDVDMAKEMTEFTKNNVLTQAAVGMLAQANSMSQLALSLL